MNPEDMSVEDLVFQLTRKLADGVIMGRREFGDGTETTIKLIWGDGWRCAGLAAFVLAESTSRLAQAMSNQPTDFRLPSKEPPDSP